MSEVTKIAISLGVLVGAAVLGLVVHSLIIRLISRWHSKRPILIRGMPLRLEHWRAPLRAIFPAALVALPLPALYLSPGLLNAIRHVADRVQITPSGRIAMGAVDMRSGFRRS